MKYNMILHNSKSVILIENNGRLSCSKRSRYLNIYYFCTKDLINDREAEGEYYPAE